MNDHYDAGFHGKNEIKEKMFDPGMDNYKDCLASRKEIWKKKKFEQNKAEVVKIRELKNISKKLSNRLDKINKPAVI